MDLAKLVLDGTSEDRSRALCDGARVFIQGLKDALEHDPSISLVDYALAFQGGDQAVNENKGNEAVQLAARRIDHGIPPSQV